MVNPLCILGGGRKKQEGRKTVLLCEQDVSNSKERAITVKGWAMMEIYLPCTVISLCTFNSTFHGF